MDAEKSNIISHWFIVLLGTAHALTFDQWISIGLLAIGFTTLAINFYFKKKHYELSRLMQSQNLDNSRQNADEQRTENKKNN